MVQENLKKVNNNLLKLNKKIDMLFKYYVNKDMQFKVFVLHSFGVPIEDIPKKIDYRYTKQQVKDKLKEFKDKGIIGEE